MTEIIKRVFGFNSQVETRTIEEVDKVLDYASQTETSLTRIMLDNMVVPLPNGDVDVTMLEQAVNLIGRRFETEVLQVTYSVFLWFPICFICRPKRRCH